MMSRRLPKPVERELGKLCGTLGFKDYADFFWNISCDEETLCPKATVDRLHDGLFALLLEQARHDASVAAIGEEALRGLPQRMRALANRAISSAQLFGADPKRLDALFVVGSLDLQTIGEIIDLQSSLRRLGASECRIIVTDQLRSESVEAHRLSHLEVLFWRDAIQANLEYSARLMAMYIHAVGSPVVFCLRTVVGIETIALFAHPLDPCHSFFLSIEAPKEGEGVAQAHNLRVCAKFARILVRSEADADLLRPLLAHIENRGLVILPRDGSAADDALETAFGHDFADRRTPLSISINDALLGPRTSSRPAAAILETGESDDAMFDVSVAVLFHRERDLSVPALASLRDMVVHARQSGLRVESMIVLDNGDAATCRIVEECGSFVDHVHHICVGDPAHARNFAARQCRGRFVTFLDGDDLWGKNWLVSSYAAATADEAASYAIWHCEACMEFFPSDCNRTLLGEAGREAARSSFNVQMASDDPDFEPKDLLLESLWTANAFALRDIYLRFPQRPSDWARRHGIEDWLWNRETLGHGLVHRIVPDTIHLIRVKEDGSLGQAHEASRLLPIIA